MNRYQYIIKNTTTGEVQLHDSYTREYGIGDTVISDWVVTSMGVTGSFKERFQALLDDEMNSFLADNAITDEAVTPNMAWQMTDAIETLLDTIAEFKLAWLKGGTDAELEVK